MDTTSEISNPHDHFFKNVYSRKEVVQDHLTQLLSPQIQACLDFNSLEISKDSFIDHELREYHSDLLYKLKTKDENSVFIYFLFEHKSHPEPLIAFQLLKYMIRIWEQIRKQSETNSFPIIIPMVIYHGKENWNIKPFFSSLFYGPKELKSYIPEFLFELNDLSRFDDDEVKGKIITRVALLLLKNIYSEDIGKRFENICKLLRELKNKQTALEFLETALKYVCNATENVKEENIHQGIINALGSEGEQIMPTIAEQWREEGRIRGLKEGLEQGLEQGIEQGLEQGREVGKIEGLQEGIKLALELKFGTDSTFLFPHIDNTEDIQKLKEIEIALRTVENIQEIQPFLKK